MSIDLHVVDAAAPGLSVPKSLVVRYGYMKMMGEFPYDGDTRPGCGARVVIRTRRGTELAEVVTTTCSNGGCAKSLTRDKMMDYIAKSGGDDFPFTTDGVVMRIATPQDLAEQAHVESGKGSYVSMGKGLIAELKLPMKLVEVEQLLGGEMVTFFFLSEHRVDFRSMVKQLSTRFHTRIHMHQVGARDEARLVADYETCGQHCCCKQFLKVLKPVNMGAAKMQKATLDPNKISGRCGRLKCCLRYEEATYDELRRKLPRVGTRVRTTEGIGTVVEAMILTQLVKVRLENDRFVAVANEEILERDIAAGPALRDATPDRLGQIQRPAPVQPTQRNESQARSEAADRRHATPEGDGPLKGDAEPRAQCERPAPRQDDQQPPRRGIGSMGKAPRDPRRPDGGR